MVMKIIFVVIIVILIIFSIHQLGYGWGYNRGYDDGLKDAKRIFREYKGLRNVESSPEKVKNELKEKFRKRRKEHVKFKSFSDFNIYVNKELLRKWREHR